MHVAAERNLMQVMEMFIDLGGDITEKNNQGFTCLHIAAREGHNDMVKLLLAKGKRLEVLKLFILSATGADENVRDEYGYSPSYWAHKGKYMDILE